MMRKKLISLLLCGVVSATAMAGFAGCFGGNQDSPDSSQAEKQTVKLTLWGPTEHQPMLGEMVIFHYNGGRYGNFSIRKERHYGKGI